MNTQDTTTISNLGAATVAMKIISEDIYADGSGAAGLYEVYGTRFSGIHNGSGVTVTPIGISAGRRGAKAKGIVRSGAKIVEAHLMAAVRMVEEAAQ